MSLSLRENVGAQWLASAPAAGATDGSVDWIRLDSVPVEGRMMVIQKQQGIASNYDCSTCYCPAHYTALTVAPGSFGLIPTAYQDMGSTATYSGCNGSLSYYNVTNSSTWSSNNTPVIKMDSTVHYRADAMSGGTANVLGSYTGCTQFDTNPDLDCPCINNQPKSASGAGTVVWVTLSLRTSGPLAPDDDATSTMTNILGTNILQTLLDTSGYWTTPVEVVGNVSPSTYTGAIKIRRQLLGVYVYDNCTLIKTVGPKDDTTQSSFLYDDDPQSGGSAGKVYDTDTPGIQPLSSDTVNHVYHYRANFYQYAETTINMVTYRVSSNLSWFSRVSYLKTSSGSQLSTSISGDNIAATGATNLTCDLK